MCKLLQALNAGHRQWLQICSVILGIFFSRHYHYRHRESVSFQDFTYLLHDNSYTLWLTFYNENSFIDASMHSHSNRFCDIHNFHAHLPICTNISRIENTLNILLIKQIDILNMLK